MMNVFAYAMINDKYKKCRFTFLYFYSSFVIYHSSFVIAVATAFFGGAGGIRTHVGLHPN